MPAQLILYPICLLKNFANSYIREDYNILA